jgi:uncharacterized membrane protein YidH (DUF202 family)
MTAPFLAAMLMLYFGIAIGRWYELEQADRRRQRTSWSVPTITSLPLAIAQPALVRRSAWKAWRS